MNKSIETILSFEFEQIMAEFQTRTSLNLKGPINQEINLKIIEKLTKLRIKLMNSCRRYKLLLLSLSKKQRFSSYISLYEACQKEAFSHENKFQKPPPHQMSNADVEVRYTFKDTLFQQNGVLNFY